MLGGMPSEKKEEKTAQTSNQQVAIEKQPVNNPTSILIVNKISSRQNPVIHKNSG